MPEKETFPDPLEDLPPKAGTQSIVLAGGCFWCVEAVYQPLGGVLSVMPGYAGGTAATANYKAVCTGRTGHAEAVKIDYDASRISLGQLLKIFFSVAHDSTQPDGQGNDIGPQYRSAIFYSGDEQKRIAAAYIALLNQAGVLDGSIATTLEPLAEFFPAETYHHNYASDNPDQPYIACVAQPKVDKLRRLYPAILK